MKIYENKYFRIRLEFPATWNLVSWHTAKRRQSLQPNFQLTDDDLPQEVEWAQKVLFEAALNPPGSCAIVHAFVEMSVHWLAPGEDMSCRMAQTKERMRPWYEGYGEYRSIVDEGKWDLGGTEFTFLDQLSKTRNGEHRCRFFFRRYSESLWLYGLINGNSPRTYEQAIEIVGKLNSIQE